MSSLPTPPVHMDDAIRHAIRRVYRDLDAMLLYQDLDALLLAGAFDACDAQLAQAEVENLEVAIAHLLITLTARDRLPSRASYVARVRAAAEAQGALRESPNLLDGLE